MQLHSSYRDFYDVMQRTDREPRPRFVRSNTTEHVLFRDKSRMRALAPLPAAFKEMPGHPDSVVGVFRSILGICGRLLPLYRVFDDSRGWIGQGRYRSFTDLPAVIDHLRALPVPDEPSERLTHHRMLKALEDDEKKGPVRWSNELTLSVAGWEHWLQGGGRLLQGSHDDLFRLIGAPVFLWRGHNWRVDQFSRQDSGMVLECNPVLGNLGWQRHAEPFEVWQAIDQYLGNEMALQEDPAPLSDELRRDAHGFDGRSFKTDAPGQRKARRKANKARKRSGS